MAFVLASNNARAVVESMVANGADRNSAEYETAIVYLSFSIWLLSKSITRELSNEKIASLVVDIEAMVRERPHLITGPEPSRS